VGVNVTVQQTKKSANFDPVRMAAVEALVLIERGEAIESAIAQVSQERGFRLLDRRFFLQLVNGTTKLRRRLDHELKFYLAKPSITLPLILSNILRLGLFQLRFTDRVPPAAAVSEAVNLAHVMTDGRRAKLVNAVLRASLREPQKVAFADPKEEPARYLADYYSFPDYFVGYCLKEFGYEATEALLNRFNMPPKVSYRVNYLKAKPDEISKILEEQGVSYRISDFRSRACRWKRNCSVPAKCSFRMNPPVSPVAC
jgi:16S rRNA (cytosine967-C5)-methyltransferase